MTISAKPHRILIILFTVWSVYLAGCSKQPTYPVLNHQQLAQTYYQEDAQWYLDNIPFFECSDKQLEQVYYYRWKLYKAHIRRVGDNDYVITEFINHVPWDREPYCTINAASMHHIYEGRWLKNDAYLNGYINNLYQQGGNDRRYSESVADAAYARYLVNRDSAFVVSQLDSMKAIYTRWDDHWDDAKKLYYIPAMPDATEYTIASIDASGGKDGFEGGEAFRPTINSYMYGNAQAISRIAAMKGDNATRNAYQQKAIHLKNTVEIQLWNDSLHHFTDRFKVNNPYVHYWDFIRGRELAGMAPWYFGLPVDNPKFSAAWQHLTDTTQLLGRFGLRTNEPSYQYYFKQFVFFEGKPGSQWNGPSWPFQTSIALTGMANVLNDYNQQAINKTDYLKLLRLYTQQHILPNGNINLVENYDPNKGGPIVHYRWSNHYNHSSYNNLIISGLCGIRPSEGDTLTVNPLVDESIQYFCLSDVRYHGHLLTVVYDKVGDHYKLGAGIHVFVDGKKAPISQKNNKASVFVGSPIASQSTAPLANHALNIAYKGYPIPSASINVKPDTALYQAIDGRIWYFPEITNRWTTLGSTTKTDWFALDFGKPMSLSALSVYLVADDKTFGAPDALTIDYRRGNDWIPVAMKSSNPVKLTGNTINTLRFTPILATQIRLNIRHEQQQVAITEIECY